MDGIVGKFLPQKGCRKSKNLRRHFQYAFLPPEQKKTEAELRESERYNRTLFDESRIGLVLCRLDGAIMDVNAAFAKILAGLLKKHESSPTGRLRRFKRKHAATVDNSFTAAHGADQSGVIMSELNRQELLHMLLMIFPGIKHLFMSGDPTNVIANQGMLKEGVNFIQKPFKTRNLSVKVHDVLTSV